MQTTTMLMLVQAYDQYGNIACNYSSCDDIPDAEDAIAENYSAFTEGPTQQTVSNTVEQHTVGVAGCLDANATNYDASATVQAVDQYGNLLCFRIL